MFKLCLAILKVFSLRMLIGFMLKKIGACGILKNCSLKLRKILPWIFCFDKIKMYLLVVQNVCIPRK